MTRKILSCATLAALVCASAALAAPPAGKGRPATSPAAGGGTTTTTAPQVPGAKGKGAVKGAAATGKGKPTTGVGCRPSVSVIVTGALAAAPGAGASLSVTATGGNAFARAYLAGGTAVSIALSPATRIVRQGRSTSVALLAGDLVNVQARVCKADLAGGAVPPLTAVRVVARPGAVTTVVPPPTPTPAPAPTA